MAEEERKPLNKIYKGRWFGVRTKFMWRAPIIANAIVELWNPATTLDIGCAIGDVVRALSLRGVSSWGLEGHENVIPYLVCHPLQVIISDLRDKVTFPEEIKAGRPYIDLVLCLEVAEHIEPEYCGVFLDNLTALWPRTIILTAAPPGQGGLYHVNCKPSQFWVMNLSELGYVIDPGKMDAFRERISKYKTVREMRAYYKNLMIFRRAP